MQGPNAVLSIVTYPPGATVTQARIVIDGLRGAIFEYADGGALVGSWAKSAGTDPYGNAYPAGFDLLNGGTIQGGTLIGALIIGSVIESSSTTPLVRLTSAGNFIAFAADGTQVWRLDLAQEGLFIYSDSGGSGVQGALIGSWAAKAGTDGLTGTTYPSGFSGSAITTHSIALLNGYSIAVGPNVPGGTNSPVEIRNITQGYGGALSLSYIDGSGVTRNLPIDNPLYPTDPTSNTLIPETWKTMNLQSGWTVGASGYAQYRLGLENIVWFRFFDLIPGTVANGTVLWAPAGAYVPSLASSETSDLVVTYSTQPSSPTDTPSLKINPTGMLLENISTGVIANISGRGYYHLD